MQERERRERGEKRERGERERRREREREKKHGHTHTRTCSPLKKGAQASGPLTLSAREDSFPCAWRAVLRAHVKHKD